MNPFEDAMEVTSPLRAITPSGSPPQSMSVADPVLGTPLNLDTGVLPGHQLAAVAPGPALAPAEFFSKIWDIVEEVAVFIDGMALPAVDNMSPAAVAQYRAEAMLFLRAGARSLSRVYSGNATAIELALWMVAAKQDTRDCVDRVPWRAAESSQSSVGSSGAPAHHDG